MVRADDSTVAEALDAIRVNRSQTNDVGQAGKAPAEVASTKLILSVREGTQSKAYSGEGWQTVLAAVAKDKAAQGAPDPLCLPSC